MQSYDMFVIGSGPAGQRAAIQGAKLGKRVALAEKREERLGRVRPLRLLHILCV